MTIRRCPCPSHRGDGCFDRTCRCSQHHGVGCIGFYDDQAENGPAPVATPEPMGEAVKRAMAKLQKNAHKIMFLELSPLEALALCGLIRVGAEDPAVVAARGQQAQRLAEKFWALCLDTMGSLGLSQQEIEALDRWWDHDVEEADDGRTQ